MSNPIRIYVETVDIARGIAALGVMAYHLLYYEQIADLTRVSYYFVYAFFIISGFSLYVTYRDRLTTPDELREYAAKRFRRIAPLFWVAILLYVLLVDVPARPLTVIPLNMSLAFGLANPGGTSLLTGGWSIGIEMVFYLCLPLLALVCAGCLRRLTILSVISIVLMVAFVNATLAGHPSMRDVWVSYTQPLAFFGYFAVGCLLGEIYMRRPDLKGRKQWFWLLALGLFWFTILPANTPNSLLVGWTGLQLMIATMITVTACVFLPEPGGLGKTVGKWLGRLSYATYLLHPILYVGIAQSSFTSSHTRILFTVLATILMGIAVHFWIEQRFRAPRAAAVL
nr:acyltransferase [Rhizobium sp. TCK]